MLGPPLRRGDRVRRRTHDTNADPSACRRSRLGLRRQPSWYCISRLISTHLGIDLSLSVQFPPTGEGGIASASPRPH